MWVGDARCMVGDCEVEETSPGSSKTGINTVHRSGITATLTSEVALEQHHPKNAVYIGAQHRTRDDKHKMVMSRSGAHRYQIPKPDA